MSEFTLLMNEAVDRLKEGIAEDVDDVVFQLQDESLATADEALTLKAMLLERQASREVQERLEGMVQEREERGMHSQAELIEYRKELFQRFGLTPV